MTTYKKSDTIVISFIYLPILYISKNSFKTLYWQKISQKQCNMCASVCVRKLTDLHSSSELWHIQILTVLVMPKCVGHFYPLSVKSELHRRVDTTLSKTKSKTTAFGNKEHKKSRKSETQFDYVSSNATL